MNINKILLAFLFTISILSLAEVGYLFYKSQKPANQPKIVEKGIFIPAAKTDSKQYEEMRATAEAAINPQMLLRLKNYVKSPESKLYILSEQTAQVLEIAKDGASVEDRRNGKLYPGKIYFPFAMRVSNKIMPEGYIWMYFHDPVIKKTHVYYRQGEKLEAASLRDIKTGDTITTIEKWDPSVAPDMNNLQETLTKQVVDYNIYIEK